MKLGSLASARPQYYDRTATNIAGLYQASTNSHSSTDRLTYTSPAGRKLILEVMTVFTYAGTLPAAAAYNTTSASAFNGSTTAFILVHAWYQDTADKSVRNTNAYTSVTIYPGESFYMTTQQSAACFIQYNLSYKGTLFDA